MCVSTDWDLMEISPLGRVIASLSLISSSLIENSVFRRLVCHFCGVRLGKAYRERHKDWLILFEHFTLGHGPHYNTERFEGRQ